VRVRPRTTARVTGWVRARVRLRMRLRLSKVWGWPCSDLGKGLGADSKTIHAALAATLDGL